MNKKVSIAIGIVVILILCVLFRAFATMRSEKNQAEAIKAQSVANVETGFPAEVETSSVIEAPGRVVAIKSADVICRAQGMIVAQHYKDGDFVKKGQLLYTTDPNAYNIQLERARADLDSAKAAQYKAQKDFERAAELVKNDFVSKSAYDQALANRDSANANVKAAIAAVHDAQRLLSYTRVTAPITGKISNTIITVGNYLSSPNTKLTNIVSLNPIYVTYSMDSALFSRLKDDEIIPNGKQKAPIKVQVTLPDGTVYSKTGNADFFDNAISETTGTMTMRATFPNENFSLTPGDFVQVKVFSNKVLKRLAVPQAAVLQDSDGRYLYVIDKDNVAHKRKIETDGQKDDNWIIGSGITKDEKFVTTGIIKVRDGAPVNVITKDDNEAEVEVNKKDNKE